MTDVIFSFDTEDFTQNEAADAIYREAEILRENGVRGGFCIVGLLAKQLLNWGRDDVIGALSHHDILSHSYGHSLHPTINEYTDLEDFDEAYNEVIRQETEGLRLIKETFPGREILGACPPGNQKSYVAMYAYGDMGLPIYTDTVTDAPDCRGVFICNTYQTRYSFPFERFFEDSSDEFMKKTLDELANLKRAIVYTHPNFAIFSEFWDSVNYNKENKHPFGEWEQCKKHHPDDTARFYEAIDRFIKLMKADGRFNITSYSELYETLKAEKERVITKEDIPTIKDALDREFGPVEAPFSLCLSDVFLAAKELLEGCDSHTCGKVYGFLDTPYAITSPVTLNRADIIESAKNIDTSRFLPTEITVGGIRLGPADWLRAALRALCGEEQITLQPAGPMPSLELTPRLKGLSLMGWMQNDSFRDEFLTKRIKLQTWTMRYLV